ncbi:MAG: hypothetical protein DA329_05675 [Candidatus Nitrosocosmicus sp.]|nr:hypothetical protein [Candidatus Nitrosocosmicus sp.]GKS61470.1 hypothetical protein YTPLAS21_09280 [Candidatus Nitrosocosmicus sp.]
MNDLISLVWTTTSIPITEDEKKLIYSLINNEQKNPHLKYEKLKKRFFSIFEKRKHQRKDPNQSYDFTSLLEKGLIESGNSPFPTAENTIADERQSPLNNTYKLTSIGLIHIFNNKFIYSPSLLVKYHDSLVLKDLLYKYFELKTIASSSAKFFVLITDYLSDVSSYLLGYQRNSSGQLTLEVERELENHLNLCALSLGFKVAILFKESNLISASLKGDSEKAIIALQQIETTMKRILSKDSMFQNLVSEVSSELSIAREEMLNLS